jgi:aspartate/methionine/tyrosine aminotransferase
MNQYAPSPGLPALKQAIAAHWRRVGWGDVDPVSEITITSGATEALCATFLGLINPGDEVILFEPAYDAYAPDVIMAGGTPRFVRLHPPAASGEHSNDWWFEPADLVAAFGPRTKAVVINTPHNPTGKVFTRPELELVARLCQEHDVLAIADEVYDQLVFDGAVHVPLATLPGMWERTLTINSTGKTFSVTGWKIGYAVGPANLNHALRQAHQWTTFATATPFQQAASVALTQAPERGYYDELRAEYLERRDLLAEVLHEAGLPTLPNRGSYFLMADITGAGFATDVDFCRWLTAEVGVAAIPPSAFYQNPAEAPLLARFCFAKSLDTIRAASERLQRVPRQR